MSLKIGLIRFLRIHPLQLSLFFCGSAFLTNSMRAFAHSNDDSSHPKEMPQEDERPGCDNSYARKFFYHCRRGRNEDEGLSMLLAVGWRGVLSERGNISELLNFEAGARYAFPRAVDLALGAGSLFAEGGKANLDVHGRVFLLNASSGPYVGGGYVFQGKKQAFATLGLFGGSGLFFEFNFREGANKPVAAIPNFGLRFVF